MRVALDKDTDAEALGAWLRRTQGECDGKSALCSVEFKREAR